MFDKLFSLIGLTAFTGVTVLIWYDVKREWESPPLWARKNYE